MKVLIYLSLLLSIVLFSSVVFDNQLGSQIIISSAIAEGGPTMYDCNWDDWVYYSEINCDDLEGNHHEQAKVCVADVTCEESTSGSCTQDWSCSSEWASDPCTGLIDVIFNNCDDQCWEEIGYSPN